MKQDLKPPPTLESCRVLEYAILESSAVHYSGHSNLFVGDEEIGPVPRLAICQVPAESGVYLFHCAHEWATLGSEKWESLQAAKTAVEEVYRGVSALWIDAHVTDEDAARHLEE